MEKIIKNLEKYGKWQSTKNYFYNCFMPEYGGHAFLNILYKNPHFKEVKKVFKDNGIRMNHYFENFYKKYNGLSFFAHSLKLYGYQPCDVDDQAPIDFEKSNFYKKQRFSFLNNFFIFGSCSHYLFCLDVSKKSSSILVIDQNKKEIVREFTSLIELLNYCISNIEPLYSINGVYIKNETGVKAWFNNAINDDIF